LQSFADFFLLFLEARFAIAGVVELDTTIGTPMISGALVARGGMELVVVERESRRSWWCRREIEVVDVATIFVEMLARSQRRLSQARRLWCRREIEVVCVATIFVEILARS